MGDKELTVAWKRCHKRVLFLIAWGVFLFGIAHAQAASVYRVKSDAAAGGDGSSWEKTLGTLQDAVNAAASEGGEVWVAAGTYVSTGTQVVSIPSQVQVYGGFTGTETVLTDRNPTANQTVIDGQGSRQGVKNVGFLDGFTVQNGRGGGIYNNGTVTNCTVTGNSAASNGGGIYNSGTVTNCTVTGNSTTGSNGGGGIYNEGTATNCTVMGNSATGTNSSGGGIYNYGTVTNCTVTANSANGSGGGISNSGTVMNCTVTGNSATGSYGGGGIYNDGTVTNSIVWRNDTSDIAGSLAEVTYSCFGEATAENTEQNLRANPRFVSTVGDDPQKWDLRLSANSPCIDAGTTTTQNLPATDLAGNPRPGGDGLVDMGAYESPDAWTPGIPAPPVVLFVSPQGDGSTGQDWAHAFQTITSATQVVQTDYDFYEIRVAAGTYHEGCEVVLPGRVSLIGGWSGNVSNPNEWDVALFKTVVDGGNAYRCIKNYGCLYGFTVQNGNSDDSGGGINNSGTVTNCTVTGNSTTGYSGGGIYNSGGMVTNCTVTGNSTTGYSGGGIYNNYHGTVTNCTVTGNSATGTHVSGGGIYNADSSTVTNCIVWRNGTSDIVGYLDWVTYSCFGEASTENTKYNLRMNPRFVSTSGNDPLLWDLHLQVDSPCIDAGTTATQNLPTTDLAGNPRPGDDGLVDMGVYESPDAWTPRQPAPPVTLFVSPSGNGSTGQDWTHAFQTITSATQSIQSNDDLYEIRVAAGTYREGREIVLPGRANLIGGWSGNISNPGERDVTVYKTVVDGENAYRCVWNYGLLDGLWVQNGSTTNGFGGGIYNSGTVTNCTMTSNSAYQGGGGIYNAYSSTVRNCTMTSNSAIVGAGIFNAPQGAVTNCRVTGNAVKMDGGGIYNDGTVTNCTVTRNSAYQGGGGIYNWGMVTNCTVTGNSAYRGGGGIYNAPHSSTVTNCTVTGNSAKQGGGIYNYYRTVTNCTVAGNSATGSGGGIYNYSGTVTNCTVTENSATGSNSYGGGIYNSGTVTNSIVWRNDTSDMVGFLADVTYSCFGEATDANHNLRANPRFVSTVGDDPQKWDLRLLANSPCIDAGTTTTQNLPATDLAGNPRPGGDGLVDMGAYESPDAWTPGIPSPPVTLFVSPFGDGSTGQDWAHAFQTITSATQVVQTDYDFYEIRVAAGTYREGREVALPGRASLIGGWSGNISNPDARDVTLFKTVVDGEDAYRCVTNYGFLDGLWIQNGSGTNASKDGGGIYNMFGTVTNCTMTSNSVTGSGGGIYNYYGTVINCTMTSNSATGSHSFGGGIFNMFGTVTNCTMTGNSATGFNSSGGGIYNAYSSTVTNCTVTGNSATGSNSYGGGIFNYGTVTNCIVWRNSVSDVEGDLSGVSYSCFGESTGGNHTTSADPKFVSMTDANPLTWDLRLQASSPCIDAGTMAVPNLPAIDLLGNPRAQGEGVDMGAYETQTQLSLMVETNPVNICTVSQVPDQATYMYGTTVTLTAIPKDGYHFTGWTGNVNGSMNPLIVTMDSTKTLTANFTINEYSLTATAENGSVAKSPDQATYTHGTTARLTATPAAGYHFISWSGATTSTANPLDTVMDSTKTLTANFAINEYALTVEAEYGSVAKSPEQVAYAHGTTVTLTATPSTGYHFTGWSGATTSTLSPLDLVMDSTKTLTANFALNEYALVVEAAHGSVANYPTQVAYAHGTTVTLTATPATGYHFTGWSGATTSTLNPFVVVMDSTKTLTAHFSINEYALTVTSDPPHSGTVAKSPEQVAYAHGTTVTLTATPSTGYHFTGWNGATTSTLNPLDLVMDSTKTLTANFALNEYALVVEAVHGSVTKSPDQASYTHGTTVTLTATPAVGYYFTGWSGSTTSTLNPLVMTLDSTKTLAANFEFSAPASVTAVGNTYRVLVNWSPLINARGYVLERMASTSNTSPVIWTLGSVTEFADDIAVPGVVYSYRVAALDDAGNSGTPSEAVTASVTPEAGVAVNYKVTAKGYSLVRDKANNLTFTGSVPGTIKIMRLKTVPSNTVDDPAQGIYYLASLDQVPTLKINGDVKTLAFDVPAYSLDASGSVMSVSAKSVMFLKAREFGAISIMATKPSEQGLYARTFIEMTGTSSVPVTIKVAGAVVEAIGSTTGVGQPVKLLSVASKSYKNEVGFKKTSLGAVGSLPKVVAEVAGTPAPQSEATPCSIQGSMLKSVTVSGGPIVADEMIGLIDKVTVAGGNLRCGLIQSGKDLVLLQATAKKGVGGAVGTAGKPGQMTVQAQPNSKSMAIAKVSGQTGVSGIFHAGYDATTGNPNYKGGIAILQTKAPYVVEGAAFLDPALVTKMKVLPKTPAQQIEINPAFP